MRRARRTYAGFSACVLVSVVLLAGGAAHATVTVPTFAVYASPPGTALSSGEPSIGIDRATGNVMFQAGTRTLRVRSFGANGVADWKDVSPLLTEWATLDPILFVDQHTGQHPNRTFVSQLTAACSLFAFSDDDGATWTNTPAGCAPGAMVDHQSVGGGPFGGSVFGPAPWSSYPNAVYYCAQALLSAQCGVSLDGGLTFGPAVPIYTALQCNGGHGHIRVAPDRSIWIPHQYCSAEQAAVVSQDGGLTWSVNAIPGSTTQSESDPSVAIDSAGRAYECMEGGAATPNGSSPQVSTTTDHGEHWTAIKTLSSTIRNVQFPAMIAGTPGRAACAFLGSTTGGDDQSSTFKGTWSVYVATTYDGGATWSVANASGADPVQRGPICMAGTTCSGARNLKDFIDIAIDRLGYIYVAFADGCTGACAGTSGTVAQSTSALATIARQSTLTSPLCAPTACP